MNILPDIRTVLFRNMSRFIFIVILTCGTSMILTQSSYAYVETLKGDAQSVSNYIQLTSLDYGLSGQLEFRRLRLGEWWKIEGEFWVGGGRGGQALYIYVWSRGTPTSEDEAKRQYSINYNEYTNAIHLKYDGEDLITPVKELGMASASWRNFQVEFRHGFFYIYLDRALKVSYLDPKYKSRMANIRSGIGARTGGIHNEHRVRLVTWTIDGQIEEPSLDNANVPPIITNARVQQVPNTTLVEILYDLEDLDGDLVTIAIDISSDGGETFNVPAESFSGDVGLNILSGFDKRIIWYAGIDIPHVLGVDYVAKITGDDGFDIEKEEEVLEEEPIGEEGLTRPPTDLTRPPTDLTGPPTEEKPISYEIRGDQEIVWLKDGSVMRFVRGGEFDMGSNQSPEEFPTHPVSVSSFYMDVNEITVGQYKLFIEETDYKPPNWKDVAIYSHTDDHPMIEVNWYDAMSYAEWSDKRLPTEAEWEYAARGGLIHNTYVWGNEGPDLEEANYGNTIKQTTVGGAYEPNGYGLHDMSGNVWEWCLDEFQGDFYAKSDRVNPLAGELLLEEILSNYKLIGTERVSRGGSFETFPAFIRVSFRDSRPPSWKYNRVGFRCIIPIGR
ncbi:TPA: hypothetical protein EYN98_00535 [Candidatus Poribacteria bacterium]|nr:hypothetical protein [Candidatus Poribacteria bacterium]HIA64567.1 hypothetical protein [Candidatus Poribacteria bacterium]HIB90196.1 hypothetical protein [Candidatus Poribacteria bacterium]HIB99481.1 hypothetical protein [Candidatus Poribacteria bacterium]HIN29820.1 hypothetical protein [Candidatus Poribacteria bacterium]